LTEPPPSRAEATPANHSIDLTRRKAPGVLSCVAARQTGREPFNHLRCICSDVTDLGLAGPIRRFGLNRLPTFLTPGQPVDTQTATPRPHHVGSGHADPIPFATGRMEFVSWKRTGEPS
jgi:hypothetical protein